MNGEVKDEDLVCEVCRDGGWSASNRIVLCEECLMPVHQTCYGIDKVPEGDIPWYCNLCLVNCEKKKQKKPIINPLCILCHEPKGPLKQINESSWIHTSCALAIPEISFKNIDDLEKPHGYDTLTVNRRKTFICNYCNEIKGVTMTCSIKSCSAIFHIPCGHKNRCIFELRATSGDKKAYCHKHRMYFFKNYQAKMSSNDEYQMEIAPKSKQKQEVRRKVIDMTKVWKLAEEIDAPFNENALSQFLGEETESNTQEGLGVTKTPILTKGENSELRFKELTSDFRITMDFNPEAFNKSYLTKKSNIVKVDERVNLLYSLNDGHISNNNAKTRPLKGCEKYDNLLRLASLQDFNSKENMSHQIFKTNLLLHKKYLENKQYKLELKKTLKIHEPQLFESLKLSVPEEMTKETANVSKKRSHPDKVDIDMYLPKRTKNIKSFGYRDITKKVATFLLTEEERFSLGTEKIEPPSEADLLMEYQLFKLGLNSYDTAVKQQKARATAEKPLYLYITCTGPGKYVCTTEKT